MTVIKRDGSEEELDLRKIHSAIEKAFEACCSNENKEVIDNMIKDMNLWDKITIEEIQDIVIETLRDYDYDDVADKYKAYKDEQSKYREILAKVDYQDYYVNSTENAATASETDGNANVVSKNVATLESEVGKRENRLIQRYRMKRQLKQMGPEYRPLASQYTKDLEGHEIYAHDEASTPVLKQYCMAATTFPLMTEGVGNIDGVTPTPPNDLQSFSGQASNAVFLLSSQCKGAVALGDFFVTLNYYIIAEFGENWYDILDESATSPACKIQRTVRDIIYKAFKQFVWGVNQPAGNRSYQSPFTNISYFDHTYFTSMFKDFFYPDGTQPEWTAIDNLQRLFMKWFNRLRLKQVLTFPVNSAA